MRTEQIPVREALAQGMALPYALVRSLSQVALGRTPAAVDLDELLEVRFFSEAEEIRIFYNDGGLQAVRLLAEADDISMAGTVKLMNAALGSEITFRREISFDKDGQAYFSTTRMTGWKGGPD